MYAHLHRAVVGGSRTAPTEMLAGQALCDAVVRECPIALSVCVIPVGAVRETSARRSPGRRPAMPWCMYAHLRRAVVGGSRTAPTEMSAGPVLRDVTMQCPIAVPECFIPVGAFRETPACRSPGVRRTSIRQRLSACFHVLYDGVYPVWRRA